MAMAKSVTERKREERVRDKLNAKEKEALLLSRKIVTALYHSDDAALKRTMARNEINEEQNLISGWKWALVERYLWPKTTALPRSACTTSTIHIPSTSPATCLKVTIKSTPYVIVDISLRMLQPAELYKAQGFPADYIISHGVDGKPFTKTQQVHMCGNSVSPPAIAALARASDPWRAAQQQAEAA